MSRPAARLWIFLALALLGSVTKPHEPQAHALDPAYLDLKVLPDASWKVYFRVPDVQGHPMDLNLDFGSNCVSDPPPAPLFDGRGWSATWRIQCKNGLSGTLLKMSGLENTKTDALVRCELAPDLTATWRLIPAAPSFVVPQRPGAEQVFLSYFGLGVEHILLGWDHLLFVFALFILISNRRRLVATITAFTLAHSVTLGLVALEFLHVPGAPVEAIIALSIIFLAAEIVYQTRGRRHLTGRAPWLIAFGFGLVHGLGFGGALKDIGLPDHEVASALLAFNIGVEAGQLAFVAFLAGVARAARTFSVEVLVNSSTGKQKGLVLLAYGIGGPSAFWFLERIAAF